MRYVLLGIMIVIISSAFMPRACDMYRVWKGGSIDNYYASYVTYSYALYAGFSIHNVSEQITTSEEEYYLSNFNILAVQFVNETRLIGNWFIFALEFNGSAILQQVVPDEYIIVDSLSFYVNITSSGGWHVIVDIMHMTESGATILGEGTYNGTGSYVGNITIDFNYTLENYPQYLLSPGEIYYVYAEINETLSPLPFFVTTGNEGDSMYYDGNNTIPLDEGMDFAIVMHYRKRSGIPNVYVDNTQLNATWNELVGAYEFFLSQDYRNENRNVTVEIWHDGDSLFYSMTLDYFKMMSLELLLEYGTSGINATGMLDVVQLPYFFVPPNCRFEFWDPENEKLGTIYFEYHVFGELTELATFFRFGGALYTGTYRVAIHFANSLEVQIFANRLFGPEESTLFYEGEKIHVDIQNGTFVIMVFRDGVLVKETAHNEFELPAGEYDVEIRWNMGDNYGFAKYHIIIRPWFMSPSMIISVLVIVTVALILVNVLYRFMRNILVWNKVLSIEVLTKDAGIKIYGWTREEMVDSSLLAGFIAAINSFVSEMVHKKLEEYAFQKIEHQNLNILICVGKYAIVAVLCASEAPALRKAMASFLRDFESKYGETLEDWNGDLDYFENVEKLVFRYFNVTQTHG